MNTKTKQISSGLTPICYMSEQYEAELFDMFPAARLYGTEALIAEKDAEIAILREQCRTNHSMGLDSLALENDKLREEVAFYKASCDDERNLRVKAEQRVVELREEVARLKENTSQHCPLCEQAAKEVERLTRDRDEFKFGQDSYQQMYNECSSELKHGALPELLSLREQVTKLTAALEVAQKDSERIDFILEKALESRTGVTIDYHKYVEDGTVIERGFRIAWFHNLNSRHGTLREAIDSAMKPEVPKCNTCNGEGGWEAAASSTNYFWKQCPDCDSALKGEKQWK